MPARDSRALATAITRLLDDGELRERMGNAGRARVAEKFTLAKMVEQVLAVYNLILETN